MTALSTDPRERARKAYSDLLSRLEAPGTQGALAVAMGVAESTVSRTKNDKTEDALVLLYFAGFKVVRAEKVCVDRERYEAMTTIASAAMADKATAQRLIWDAD